MTPEEIANESEASHQRALMCWCSTVGSKQYSELRWIFAIPNGGFRTKAGAGALRAEGVKKGVPDIFLPVKRGSWLGLFIELKRPKQKDGRRAGFLSKDQSVWIDYLKDQGYGAVVCRGWDQARDIIIHYLEWKDNK